MVAATVEVGTPAAKVFSSYLHIGCDTPNGSSGQVLPVAGEGWFVGRIAVAGLEASHAVGARHKQLWSEVVLHPGIPSHHGECLHLSLLLGVGDQIYV